MANSVKRNATVLTIATLFATVTQIIQFVLMGRVMPESEIGIASTVLVVVTFAQMFTDFGLSGYYVHRQNANQSEKSTLYWLNILLGALVAIVVVILTPLISWFYHQPELTNLILLAAVSFPIIAAGSQLQAALLKTFNYKALATIEVLTRLIGLAAFAYFVLNQYGAMSIVVAHLSVSLSKTALLFLVTERGELPHFSFQKKYVGGSLSYGIYLILGQFLNQLTLNLDKILIGKFLGMANLGLYTLGKDLAMRSMQVINPIVNKLCMPRYAAKQDNIEALTDEAGNTYLILSFFSTLMFFSLSICSPLLVEVLFGSDKLSVVPVFSVLAFYVMFRSFGNVTGTLLAATGNTKLDFKWNLLAATISLPTIFLLVQHSIDVLIVGMVLLQAILTMLSYFILIKPCVNLTFGRFVFNILLFPVIALLSFIGVKSFIVLDGILALFIFYGVWLTLYLALSCLVKQQVINLK